MSNYSNKELFEETSKKLEVLQKRQLSSQQYFNKKENYTKMTNFIDSSLKSKVKSDKQNSEFNDKVITKLSNLLKNLTIAEDKNLMNVNAFLTKKADNFSQTEGDDIELNLKKFQELEKENERNIQKMQKNKKDLEVKIKENEDLTDFNEKIKKEVNNSLTLNYFQE